MMENITLESLLLINFKYAYTYYLSNLSPREPLQVKLIQIWPVFNPKDFGSKQVKHAESEDKDSKRSTQHKQYISVCFLSL